jgi:hypothetical protein
MMLASTSTSAARPSSAPAPSHPNRSAKVLNVPFYFYPQAVPPGDPAGMRATAMSLRALAAGARQTRTRVLAAARDMSYSGPGASRFGRDMAGWQASVLAAVERLESAASELSRAAGTLEAEQARVRAHNERMRQLAMEHAAAANRKSRS